MPISTASRGERAEASRSLHTNMWARTFCSSIRLSISSERCFEVSSVRRRWVSPSSVAMWSRAAPSSVSNERITATWRAEVSRNSCTTSTERRTAASTASAVADSGS